MNSYIVDYKGTHMGYGIVYANSREEAREKALNEEIDIVDNYGNEITEIINISEELEDVEEGED